MKKSIALVMLFFAGWAAHAQENTITLNGGYSWIAGDEVFTDLSGWRINGVYEFATFGGNLSQGLAFGYTNNSGTFKPGTLAETEVSIGSWPIYWQPKYTLGDGKFQAFIEGALGWQFSKIQANGSSIGIETNDSGFYGGGGAGVVYNFTETFFFQAAYEIAWMSNYYSNDGWLNSAMGGLGFRF